MRRPHARLNAVMLLVAAALAPLPAVAGLFDDDEARKQIYELIRKTDERFDTSAKAQLELAKQIEALNAEIAKLRGQNEVLTYELEAAQKRQRDFYVDLDTRTRKLETAAETAAAHAATAEGTTTAAKPKTDPAAEARDYEAALNLFKQSHYKEALTAFDGFLKTYPESSMAPSAQYWLGNTHYALHDCKKTIDAQNELVSKWPTSPKAPDALLAVATCQQETTGGAAAARKTLDHIVASYPGTPAADTAKSRLKKK